MINFSYGDQATDSDSKIKKNPDAKKFSDKKSKKDAKPSKEKTTSPELTQLKNKISELYKFSKQGEKITTLLKKANDLEGKELKKLSGDIKSIYSKTKNSDAKKLSEDIQKQIKDVESDKKQIAVIDADIKKMTKEILAVAKENKITKSDLDKIIKDNKKDKHTMSNFESQERTPIKLGQNVRADVLGDLDGLAEVLFGATPDYERQQILEEIAIRQYHEKQKNSDPKNTKPKTSEQKDQDAPPESILDDLDPTIRGPDINEPKSSKEQKPNAENPDAPPESILDDIDTNYGADIGPKLDPKLADGLIQRITDELGHDTTVGFGLMQKMDDVYEQMEADQIMFDLERERIIKDLTRLPETKTDTKLKPAEVKPKSTQPEKKEQSIIQKDPIITESKPSNTKPTLSIPKQVTYEATGPSGANVPYSTSSQDKEDGSLTPTCDQPSGSMFPIGATAVSCTVTDSNNNSISGTFTITVRDTTPPAFAPFQPTEGVRDDTGVQVFFDVTAADLVDGNVPVSCNYQSGYKFPPGVTTLTCSASDSRGNQSTKNVQITVTVTES